MSRNALMFFAFIVTSLAVFATSAGEFVVETPFKFQSIIVKQNFECRFNFEIVREETISWSGCQGGVPYACTQTWEVVERCIAGDLVPVRSNMIDEKCGVTGGGAICPLPGSDDGLRPGWEVRR